jgi:hypothetical protein
MSNTKHRPITYDKFNDGYVRDANDAILGNLTTEFGKYAIAALNSHDELVRQRDELIAAREALTNANDKQP